MPIYEYKCPQCGAKKETIGTYIETIMCKCGHGMERIMSIPAFKIYTKVR